MTQISEDNHGLLNPGKEQQYFISVLVVCFVAALGLGISGFAGYHVVALMLLVAVSILAMVYAITPVMLAAVLSALIWDYFFIPPHYNFTVGNTEDQLLLMMYFIIASLNAVLTSRIRRTEKKVREQEDRANAIKFYNTLLNSLSHELRTPITAIAGAADNLQSNRAHLSDENRIDLVKEISIAASRLNEQVGNLLNMSRVEAGIILPKKDWCDINELIHLVLNKFNTDSGHIIKIQIAENLPLFSLDYVLMQQVLYNLLNNAMLYTPPGTIITVMARCGKGVSYQRNGTQKVNNNLILTLADNGPGFPEQEVLRVFDKFYRLQGAKAGGTGLGLSIVKGFVEAQGGTIRLEKIKTGGARFTIEIACKTSYINALKNE